MDFINHKTLELWKIDSLVNSEGIVTKKGFEREYAIVYKIKIRIPTIGIIFFLITFHYKLHSIKEPAVYLNAMVEFFSKANFIFWSIVGLLFASICLIVFNRDYQDQVQLHVRVLFLMATFFIIIFKHYINQNHNLKLYLSVYHQIPAPVLPWQLPENFDPNSVKLEFIPYDNE